MDELESEYGLYEDELDEHERSELAQDREFEDDWRDDDYESPLMGPDDE